MNWKNYLAGAVTGVAIAVGSVAWAQSGRDGAKDHGMGMMGMMSQMQAMMGQCSEMMDGMMGGMEHRDMPAGNARQSGSGAGTTDR